MLQARRIWKLALLASTGLASCPIAYGQDPNDPVLELRQFSEIEQKNQEAEQIKLALRLPEIQQPQATDPQGQALTQSFNTYFTVNQAKSPEQELLGTTLQPVDKLFRAQVELPDDQGLVVGAIEAFSPAAKVGLKPNDILLSLADKPLGKFEDLTAALKSSEGELSLVLLRKGKKETIKVKPISVVSFGPVSKTSTSYVIGVAVNPVDDVLREHLNSEVKDGLVATEVIEGKPAKKKGVKAGDILLSIDGDPLKTTQDLTSKLQESKGKIVVIEILRGTEHRKIEIEPEVREVPVDNTMQSIRLFQTSQPPHPELFQTYGTVKYNAAPSYAVFPGTGIREKPKATDPQIEALEAQIKALQLTIEKLKNERKGTDKR